MKKWALLMAVALFGAVLPWVSGASPAAAAPVSSRFVPVTPCRLADTRTGAGFERLSPHVIRVRAAGRCGIGSGPSAVALSMVMVDAGFGGFLTVYPTGTERPNSSVLNFQRGQTRANAAIVRVGDDGSFEVYQATSGHIVIDTTGFFEPAASATSGRFVPLAPSRLLDTRTGAPVPPGGTVVVPLPSGIPADAAALSLNITITEATAPGFVSTFPAGGQRPDASVLNIDAAGQTRASGGIHAVGPNGIAVFVSGGGHVVVDVSGWFTGAGAPSSTEGLFTPADPRRLLDTRYLSPLGLFTRIAPGGTVAIPTPGGRAATLALNLTSEDGLPGFVTAYPVGTQRPNASSLNPTGAGDTVANFAIVPASAEGLEFYSMQPTHLLVDLAGTFSAALTASAPPVPTTTTTTTTTTPPTTTTTPPTTTTTPPTTTTTTTTTAPTTTTTTAPATTTTPPPPGSRGIVYLTFDDGPEPTQTARIMSLLEQYGIRGTFFVVGGNVASQPALAASITARGHAIGNHTYTHPDMRTRTDAEIRQQLRDTQAAIQSATGRTPGCMRPPYGYVDPTDGPPVSPVNPNVRNVINGEGLAIVMWTHDTDDWRNSTSAQSIVNVLNTLPTAAGAVSNVLMHDFAGNSYTALAQWLPANASRYDFRVVPSC